ncbi:P-loop containing nucleoside triphosphate hydrolase protein [Zychaea mexicana]|uniref:P-loop containing nucleoside triphosphate hydrolase protein n=1 Tax=Zychaea mexicana TaxID=64656 RepID=UPI0022FE7E0C|nr:P-loop containing nucleoside triphosphate hydrolase protein [Zychaea mexicana]KAI9496440.1 P-loop containing nucleoside triphosphate hydrolase protein [Zychaea mexicana]
MDWWINAVIAEIGGCRDLIEHITTQWHTLLQSRSTTTTTLDSTTLSLLPRSKGILLHGKPGTGKTAMAMAIAKYSKIPYHVVNGPDIFMSEQGASESKLLRVFNDIRQNSIVIVDEIDLLAGSLKGKKGDLDVRIASTLLSILDRLNQHPLCPFIYIIGLTSRLHAMDGSFLRAGRLDDVHEVVIKTSQARREILEIMAQRIPFASDTDRSLVLGQVAQVTHGFVPSDLQSLCTQVVLQLIHQKVNVASSEHFENALRVVRPSNMSEYASKIPRVRFADLFGVESIIQEIKTSVIYPFHNPDKYTALGIAPPRGIMVYGPPGCGKTMLCCALASETGVNFMFVESSQVRSKVVGESESNLAKLFAHARANAPCILFIDQIDMLLPKRGTSSSSENTSDRIVTSFLTAMDGLLTKSNTNNVQIDVLVVGATNRIEAIDPAVLRPGRFDEHIHVQRPNQKQRLAIIEGLCAKMPTVLTEEERIHLATETDRWTGASLDNLFREAAMVSLRESVQSSQITSAHIQKARDSVQSLVS